MTGVLSTVDLDDASLVEKAENSPGLVGRDLVQEVMPDSQFEWTEGLAELAKGPESAGTSADANGPARRRD